MKISMIAAMDRNRVIGAGEGGLPWRLPRDIRHFREYTAGKHLLLGRRTAEEMAGWFTDHIPCVLSRREGYLPPRGRAARSVDEAVGMAFEEGAPELVVCGGAATYAAALPYADALVLTLVDAETGGEVRFPDYTAGIEWEKVGEDSFPADAEHEHGARILTLRRVSPSSLRPGRLHLL